MRNLIDIRIFGKSLQKILCLYAHWIKSDYNKDYKVDLSRVDLCKADFSETNLHMPTSAVPISKMLISTVQNSIMPICVTL